MFCFVFSLSHKSSGFINHNGKCGLCHNDLIIIFKDSILELIFFATSTVFVLLFNILHYLKKHYNWKQKSFWSQISVSLLTFIAPLDHLTCMHIHNHYSGTGTHAHAHSYKNHTHIHTHTLRQTHTGPHALLDFEALRPPCPSFQTLSRQEKNLGHQLSSLNLSITVTLDQWCRTHPSSPAGPRRTGLVQSSPSYRCQESQLTARCCSWFQFVGPAMGQCQQSVLWQWVAVW